VYNLLFLALQWLITYRWCRLRMLLARDTWWSSDVGKLRSGIDIKLKYWQLYGHEDNKTSFGEILTDSIYQQNLLAVEGREQIFPNSHKWGGRLRVRVNLSCGQSFMTM